MPWYNPTDPTQRNWMLGGLAALVLIVPFRSYILAPRQETNTQLQARVETLDQQIGDAALARARGDELRERMALYERHVARLEELIPAQEEVAILMDDIQSRARTHNVDVQRMVPEPPQPDVYYDRTSYDMSVIGEYHAVGRFLTDVATLPRIVTPVQVEVQLYGQPDAHPDMQTPVIATFRIETYVLRDPAAGPPPAEVPGG